VCADARLRYVSRFFRRIFQELKNAIRTFHFVLAFLIRQAYGQQHHRLCTKVENMVVEAADMMKENAARLTFPAARL